MKLFIKIVDGQPVDHPILESNMREIFGYFDDSNIPEGYAKFERIEKPELSPYQIASLSYKLINDQVQDVWDIRSMTNEEKQEKINSVKAIPHFESWIFDENECMWLPPVEYPKDGRFYSWNEENQQWVLIV